MSELPDGWERIEERPAYVKLVKRDAVQVPKRARGEPFQRDAVVVFTDDTAGVTSGPGARRTYGTQAAEAVARGLVDVVEEWIADGMDPYGGEDLRREMDRVVFSDVDEDAEKRKVRS